MKKPFLFQVASHYYEAGAIENSCFIFPNRRSMVFFRKYLGDLVQEKGGGVPLLLPPLYTIQDFFRGVAGAQETDRLHLLLELYACYKELSPAAESLDDFIFWGDVLLGDFDDIDKYLADARALLHNVQELKSIQDHYEYLTDKQRDAVNQFLAHFRDGKGALTVNPEGEDVKARFLQLWNLLYPLYMRFRERLEEKGMSYEGMVHRSLAARLKAGTSVKDLLQPVFPEVEQFVFVGLNALTECENLLLSRMRDAGLAQFVWDFVSKQIRDKDNKASYFMNSNLKRFPQAFPIDPQGLEEPQITVVSVPSSVGQAKLAPYILSQSGANPVETAFVLPDETLLEPLLHSIPPSYERVNVTMGLPMSGSALFSLLQALGQMQLHFRERPDGWYLYHRQVGEVFASGLFRELLSEKEAEVVRKVKAATQYYVPLKELQGGPVLEKLFRPVVLQPTEASAAQNHALEGYLTEVVLLVGEKLSAGEGMLLELDFARRCHQQLNILRGTELEVLPATWLRLLERILEGISVPFRGEPLGGLQVMGPLETRALDFRNLVILSANEGVFPRKSFHSSFIPPELRKGFGLPTYEYQDAVWAYYFYRMIQRPEHVWLLYDSRTEGLKTGEESRYIKQLEYHFGLSMERRVATAPMHAPPLEGDIPKTPEHVRAIREGELSASVLQSYLACPAKFFYQFVEGLQGEAEVAESLDAGMLGNVFHRVMCQLYDVPEVTPAHIQGLLKDVPGLKKRIRTAVLKELKSIEVSGRNLVLEEVILDYVTGTLRHDASLLASSGSGGFKMIGLERRLEMLFEGFRIKGFVDRMDSYRPGELRIVDYKTGKVQEKDILITDDNAADVVDKLFGEVNESRPKIALQLFIYGLLAHADKNLEGYKLVNSIYSTSHLFTGELPDMPESGEFTRLMRERLRALLQEMVDVSVPFRRTQELKTCSYCEFKDICGR